MHEKERKILIASTKNWNISNAEKLKKEHSTWDITVITNKDELTEERLVELNPEYIFFPHWSWIIPENIFERFRCVVFHMTDLPFGRGGSPLQNLIVRGIYNTKISAIKVTKEVDAGDIYCKEAVDISEGNADCLLQKISSIIYEKMIPRIVEEGCSPTAQTGEVVTFSRRTPDQSEIPNGLTQRQIYDYIRMLDGEGYPPAYIATGAGKVVFRNAQLIDGRVIAEAEFK